MTKLIALALAVVMLVSVFALPAAATDVYSDDPQAMKDLETFGAAYSGTDTPAEVIAGIGDDQEPEETTTPAETEEVPPVTETAEIPAATEAETVPEATEPAAAQTEGPEEETVPEVVDERREYDEVPLYFQNDYPNNIYGMGTIESNGCSAACLAMVATYMTGHEYLPDEIARYFGGSAINNIARLEKGSDALKLAYRKARDWNDALAAVYDGKIVIVLVDSGSVFTQSQHFIIITGVNENGKLMVNDSWKPNYDKWDCKEGLKNGFAPSEILAGWNGAWIYDKEAMPEDPFIYYEPAPIRGEPRYGIELTQEEIHLLAKVIWVESRGECESGQQAVAEVVLNRLVSDRFPDSLKDVIYAEGQFRSAKFLKKAEPYQLQYEMIENALYGPYVLPKNVYYFATTAKTDRVWGRIGGHVFCYADN